MQAADVDVHTEQILGDTPQTGRDGTYSIPFNRRQFADAEADGPNLVVRVVRDRPATGGLPPTPAPPEYLATSSILFNAPADTTIDLVVGTAVPDLSEWERVGAALEPDLRAIAPQDLTSADVQFLANETDYEPAWISLYALAWRYSTVPAGTPAPSVAGAAPPEAYYGLFREGMPTELAALLRRDMGDLRRALQAAIQDNIIPASLGAQLEQILPRLLYPAIQSAFRAPADPAVATIGALTATAIPARANQEAFLSAYLQHRGAPADFWAALQRKPEFPAPVVEDLQYAFWLGALARDHMPLVVALQAMRKQGTRVDQSAAAPAPPPTLKTPRDLAAKDEAWWRTQIALPVGQPIGVPADVPGGTPEEKTTNYVKTVMRTLEAAFPTTVIATRLAAENVPQNADLGRFFTNSPDFDLRRDHPDAYLDSHPHALTGVADGPGVRKRLKGIQRVFKLTPHYDEMRVLLGAGLDAAQRVARVDRDTFVQRYGKALGSERRANDLHGRAEQVAAAALLVFGKFSPGVNRVDTRVTPKLL